MKILITGGTGFIGSNLCERLLNDGHYIICLDNNSTGSMDNIKHMRGNLNFEFIRHDITNPISLEIDQIYHLACPASPVAYQLNAIKTIKTNVLGTLNLLGLAKRTGARILFTSTSEVYGDPKINPQTEDYWGNVNPIGVRSCYDEGKRLAEALMFEYYRNHNVNIRIARIFNTYGPKMNPKDGRVVSNFINQCLNNDLITVYGDGLQTRSFCYIDDMIDGLIKLMNNNEIGPINLGNPNEISIKDISILVKDLTASRSEIKYLELPLDDPIVRNPDITKAKKILDWSPKINLQDGLKKTIEYYKNF